MCNCPTICFQNIFTPKQNSVPISSHSSSPPSQASGNCPSAFPCLDLPNLSSANKWKHVLYGLFAWLLLPRMFSGFLHVVAQTSFSLLFMTE